MGTHHYNLSEQFEFTGKAKILSIVGIVVGILTIAYGLFFNHEHAHQMHERTYANLLLMGYYFACVCMSATFFLAIQFVAQAGWSASILRVPQAMAKNLPLAALILIVITGLGLYTHNLYHHWHAEGLTDPNSPNYDKIIADRKSVV